MAENALLRQQLIILRRHVKRPVFVKGDRIILVLLARMARTWKQALFAVQPETLLRWHRQGFNLYWKYTSRAATPKPKVASEIVALIQEMAVQNRRHHEQNVFEANCSSSVYTSACRTIQKYMRQVRTTRPRGQNWAAFLHNHAEAIWACDAPPSH